MILGFTGTRRGMTTYQKTNLRHAVAILPERVIHGGAEGADEEFHNFIYRTISKETNVLSMEIYPTANRTHLWEDDFSIDKCWGEVVVHDPMDPLVRDRIIAGRCDHLLAAPATVNEVLRSGTWATVRYARKAGKPVTILLPWAVPWSVTGIVTEPR